VLAFIWYIPTTIIVLSFVYGIPSIYSIIRNLKEQVWIKIENNKNPENPETPLVAILLPFYREDRESVRRTFQSIARQKYPKDKLDIFIILENNDIETYNIVKESINILIDSGFKTTIFINKGSRRSKAHAMNNLLKNISGKYDVVMVLDAGDIIYDNRYIYKASKLIKNGYSIVGTKVYRISNSVIGKLSYIDTILWYNVGLPGLTKLIRVPLVSGEGLALSMEFLNIIGGFPEVLAEDAYLSIKAYQYGRRIALLDSIVYEGAPSTLSSYVKQRIRWYRGSLQCLKDVIIRYRKVLRCRTKIALAMAYLQPIALMAPFISLLIVSSSLFIEIPSIIIVIAKIELLSISLAPLYLIINGYRDKIIVLAPLNWIFQGIIALIALMPIRMPWLRTSSRSFIDVSSIHQITLRQ